MSELNLATLSSVLASQPFQFFPRIDSTQNVALSWLREGAPSGAVVIADEQLAGRGRHGRTWYTPPGVALALSVILRPTVEALPQVMMLGALAIAEMLDGLNATNANIGIKWPNDVHLNRRKASGVLPEAIWEGEKLLGVVVGMGINVRNDFSGTELEHIAISIEPALNIKVDRVELLTTILARVDYWTQHLGTPALFKAWKSRLNMLGQLVSVISEGHSIKGTVEDVDHEGALLVRDSGGILHRIIIGDISLGSN